MLLFFSCDFNALSYLSYSSYYQCLNFQFKWIEKLNSISSSSHCFTLPFLSIKPQPSLFTLALKSFDISLANALKSKLFWMSWFSICEYNHDIWFVWSVSSCFGKQLVVRHFQSQICSSL